MTITFARARLLLTVACAMVLAAGCGAGSTGRRQAAARTTPPSVLAAIAWPAWLIAREPLTANTLLASAGRLYGVLGSRGLVRLDPADGAVLARARPAVALVRPVAADGLIWTIDGDGALVGFDAASLTPRCSRPVTSSVELARSNPSLTVDTRRDELLVGAGRDVIEVDAHTGTVVRRLPIDGVVSGLTLRPDSSGLYVATLDGRLEVLDPVTGAVRSGPVETDEALLGLIATDGGLWATAAGGHGAGTVFLPAASPADGLHSVGAGSGSGVDVLRSLSTSVLWAGGAGLACADPRTGRVRVSTAGRSSGYVSDLTSVGYRLYAVYTDFAEPSESGLITLRPPAACGIR